MSHKPIRICNVGQPALARSSRRQFREQPEDEGHRGAASADLIDLRNRPIANWGGNDPEVKLPEASKQM